MTDIELVISANGCTDNTYLYLAYLQSSLPNITVVWNAHPLGYAKATNAGIEAALGDKIVLLNNDTILLEQPKNRWLKWLDQGNVSYVLEQYSPITQAKFGVFFIAMIQKQVFDTIGLLNEDYATGGCEDIEFCFEAQKAGFTLAKCDNNGAYPIYHVAEGTMHDPELVQNWKLKFHANELKLTKKYNVEYYKFLLSNNFERAVFLKDDPVFPRETTRYEWAAKNLLNGSIFEIGCTTGYGTQFFPTSSSYLGLDYDPIIVDVARDQHWGDNRVFVSADINQYALDYYDNIVAFEVIEHLDNGMEIAQKLKEHCNRLLLTVPWNEPKGFWGEHHKLHGLNESHFSDFEFTYINHAGEISDTPQPLDDTNISNLMICKWTKSSVQ
jgi:glycosyltransferase involved in cell wall biosynthesis